jgi:flagellar biosynthesis chaperone FliJ
VEATSLMAQVSGVSKPAVLVLGMHRSGTSAVAAALEHLGIVMGRSLLKGDEWNPKGYFEEREIVELNNQLLDLAGLRWDSVSVLISSDASLLLAEQQEAAKVLLDDIFKDAPVWGFKDPRMCLLSAFWKPVLASRMGLPRVLLVLRDPAHVVHSLARRDGLAAVRSAWLWFQYLLGSLEYVEASSDVEIVDFTGLLRNPSEELKRLACWLGVDADEHAVDRYASDFIAPELSHCPAGESVELPDLVVQAFTYWQEIARQRGCVKAALGAPAWRAIRYAFETQMQPHLDAVQAIFKGDKQLSVVESRIRALTHALADTEQLAFDRLDQLQRLDAEAAHVAQALATAERIVQLKTLRWQEQDQQIRSLEHLALKRLSEIEQLTARCQELESLTLQRGELAETLAAGLAQAEYLALSRLQQIHSLDAALRQTTDALAYAEKLAVERLRMLEQQVPDDV